MGAGVASLASIQSADWSLALDSPGEPGSGLGNVVQGLDDVNQCIAIILSTPPGSDPLRPTFACDLMRFIDMPISFARAEIVREIAAAIATWEPRVRVLSITADVVLDSSVQSGARLNIAVTWQLLISGASPNPQTTALTIPARLA